MKRRAIITLAWVSCFGLCHAASLNEVQDKCIDLITGKLTYKGQAGQVPDPVFHTSSMGYFLKPPFRPESVIRIEKFVEDAEVASLKRLRVVVHTAEGPAVVIFELYDAAGSGSWMVMKSTMGQITWLPPKR